MRETMPWLDARVSDLGLPAFFASATQQHERPTSEEKSWGDLAAALGTVECPKFS